jgi:hypothetical protein
MIELFPGADLPEVRTQLEMTVGHGKNTSFEQAGGLIRRLAEPGKLRSLIGQIISDDANLADISTRSYYHANSFLKVVLMTGEESPWKLRLHVWHPQPDASATTTEDIHSHRWDFTTALLTGEYCAREFKMGPGDEYYHFKYLPVGEGQAFSLEMQGRRQLCNVFEAILPAGTVYHINHEVLHSISRSAGKAAASLVLQQPAVQDFTNVYRTSSIDEEPRSEVPVQRPSVDELRAELTQFLAWL